MSRNKRKHIREQHGQEESCGTKQKNVINLSGNKLLVIITKKKNSSWIDDLDNHDKLNPNNRVYQ